MSATAQRQNNRRTVTKLVIATVAMFGFGYALIPLYSVFCNITGLNGKTRRAIEAEVVKKGVDTTRMVTVEFIANVNEGMPWGFRPLVEKVRVHPGEVTEVKFVAENHATRGVTGQAVPSLVPGTAARYFKKTECFCFTRQHLNAREKKVMPVRFVVDPALPADVTTLTLSYTFFNVQDTTAAKESGPSTKQGS